MEINRVAAVYPVVKISSYSREAKADNKGKNDKGNKDFEKALELKMHKGEGYAKN